MKGVVIDASLVSPITDMETNPSPITEVETQNQDKKPVASARRKREMRNLIKRGRIWYFKKMIHGRSAYVSLETEDLALAKAKRDQRLKKAVRDEWDEIKGPRSACATIEQIITEYRKVATVVDRIELRTVQSNAWALQNFLRWAHGSAGKRNDTVDVDKLKAVVLTDELVGKFKVNYLASAGEDRVAKEERRRGAASVLRQMRSVFSDRARLLYKELAMPKLDNFLTAARIDTEQRVHLPIGDNVLRAMDDAMMELKDKKSPLWLVHALHKFAGLRNEEIEQVRVEWFCRAPWGQVFLSVITRPYYEPKGSQGHVPITNAVAQLLAPYVLDREPGDFLVLPDANKTDRQNLVYREHADWIRKFLPADKYLKAGYELRRWSAQVMETRYGRDAAEAFLRHAPKTVAERHYFERWYPWRRVGNDVGVTLEDARGVKDDKMANMWVQGAEALTGLQTPKEDKAAGSSV